MITGGPGLAGLLLGLLAIGPGLAPGFVLSYDMVFVPDPPFSSALLGLAGGPARPVPSDAVVAVAARVIPADDLQKLILLSIIAAACSGAAALLADGWQARTGERPPLLACLAAGVFYTWNPYMAERLVMGQWALLLGYAGLPWVLRLLCTGPVRIGRARLVLTLLPAAVGGFAGMAVTGLAAAPAALARGDRAGRLATTVAALLLLSLPWIVPSLIEPVRADPAGANLFAARADTPFGALGSLALLSGIWNAQAVPLGYGGLPAVFWLLVVAAAVAGYLLRARPMRLSPGLGAAGLTGLTVAALGVTSPGRAALRDLISAWAGFAVLRDGQQFVAALALTEAIGLGAGVAWVMCGSKTTPAPGGGRGTVRAAPGPVLFRPNGGVLNLVRPATAVFPALASARSKAPASSLVTRPLLNPSLPPSHPFPPQSGGQGRALRLALRFPALALGVAAVLAPVLLLPGMAWGSAGRLHAVRYPAGWMTARQLIDSDRQPGTVLLLPWAQYRRYPWNGGEAVFDPWSRLLAREVIANDALMVGDQAVGQESAAPIRLNRVIARPGPLTGALAAAGVRYVVVDAGPLLGQAKPGAGDLAAAARLAGARLVMASRDLVVFLLPVSPA